MSGPVSGPRDAASSCATVSNRAGLGTAGAVIGSTWPSDRNWADSRIDWGVIDTNTNFGALNGVVGGSFAFRFFETVVVVVLVLLVAWELGVVVVLVLVLVLVDGYCGGWRKGLKRDECPNRRRSRAPAAPGSAG